MSRTFISDVPGVPASPSPISHAVVVGNTCHISGQLAVYDEGYRAGSAGQEAGRAFDLVFRVADAAGFHADDIVYVDIAFADIERDLAEVNDVCRQRFLRYPARTVYEAAKLPFGAKIKIQAVAMKDS
ncbi:RidA family protein [Aestuariivita sp.]|jgi:2-iminobutanoate/2-iminopropanoate deaminase|uniref:RidA family protein n=1 Tax=Aestuariivita sp. TaxID=1872407 RepID=UPI0021747FD3|nr:RidA family protein [Aestuariivita sp.]MCE8008363.1 RidA family protein [Aestuariivita sp.]